jgi:hypothetical protein
MPLVRYFFFVGATLLTLLFVLDASLPKSPAVERTVAAADLSIIRIHSDRKWPERVVFDTTLPTIVPATTRMAELAAPVPPNVAEVSAKAAVRQAFAQASPSNPNQLQPADPRKVEPKPPRKRRVIARSYAGPPTLLVAQQPRFGLFGNAIW